MTISILILLAVNCLYIFGFENTTQFSFDVNMRPDKTDREVLWFIRWYTRGWAKTITKPIYGCVVCMASVHSWPYWLVTDYSHINIMWYIIYIFALSGVNKLVNDNLSR